LKYAVQGCFNGVWGDEANGVDDLAVVRVADFNRERSRVELGDEPTVRAIPQSARNRRVLAQGDLLIEKSGGGELQPVGNVVSFDDERPSVCSNFVARMPVANDCESRFVAYVFRSLYEQGKNIPHIKQTSGIQNLDSESYLNEIAWLPERDTQLRIANFLDDKTARIDALSAEKERLVESLAELRQSLISKTVTMTGVPGWTQTRLKFLVRDIVDTEHKTIPFHTDGEYLVARTTNIKKGKLVFEGAKYTDLAGYEEWTRRAVPEPGDILFTREAPAGEACLVPEGIPLCLGQRTVLIRLRKDLVHAPFVLWSLYGGLAARFISDLSQGSTVAHFNMPDIGNIPLFVAHLEAQQARAAVLEQKLTEIDSLSAHASDHIARLREYRSSLISAAVTGQIDVGKYEVAAC
jgi:type I restriction enzyme S subunit